MEKKRARIADGIFYSILSLAYAASLAFIAWYLRHAWDYLILPVQERPFHELHSRFKPGGLWGHGFGIIGTAMILCMHVYSLRKRVKLFRNWGNLKKWLHVHIFFGVVGCLLIMVHTAGKAHGLVALSFWSMVLVFLSGFVGRFFYGAIPRRATGLAFSLEEAEELSEQRAASLQRGFARIGDAATHIASLESRGEVNRFLAKYVRPISDIRNLRKFNESGLASLRPLWGFSRRMLRDMGECRGDDASWNRFLKSRKLEIKKRTYFLKRKVKTLREAASLKRKVKRWQAIQARLYYWHVFHKPFSVIMYVVLGVHVYVAVKYGFVWIF
ncbi:MAG TPA: hypothetical protein VK465_04720 [Fibrobacteria bacterium]|nr:hypothetical protein [Fibrobacteria bacterium]